MKDNNNSEEESKIVVTDPKGELYKLISSESSVVEIPIQEIPIRLCDGSKYR